MNTVLENNFISIEDYLAGKLVSEIKHEYLEEIYRRVDNEKMREFLALKPTL